MLHPTIYIPLYEQSVFILAQLVEQLILDIFQKKYQLFATGGRDKKINIFSNSLELMGHMYGHTELIRCLEPLSTTRIASSSRDKTIKIWDIEKKYLIYTLPQGHSNMVSALCYFGKQILISGSSDHCLLIWNIGNTLSYELPQKVSTSHETIIVGIIKLDNEYVLTGDYGGEVMLWNILNLSCIRHFQGNSGCTEMKSWGRGIVGLNMKSMLTLWDVHKWKPKHKFRFVHPGGYSFQLISRRIFVRGMRSGALQIINMETGNKESVKLHMNAILGILLIARNIIVTISDDARVKIIDPLDSKCYFDYKAHKGGAKAIARLYTEFNQYQVNWYLLLS